MSAPKVTAKPMTGTVTTGLPLEALAAVLDVIAEAVHYGTVLAELIEDVHAASRLLDDDFRAAHEPWMPWESAKQDHDRALQALWTELSKSVVVQWELPAEQASALGLRLMEAAFEAGPRLAGQVRAS